MAHSKHVLEVLKNYPSALGVVAHDQAYKRSGFFFRSHRKMQASTSIKNAFVYIKHYGLTILVNTPFLYLQKIKYCIHPKAYSS